ncbi:Mitochondrial amidoxime reducing component 2 [Phytophthora citrophthora]|uniref:Mitochondrial amidoxime reducing component 2 n=1 Tax=Phytophthora citrophthora TaxID=4793 RepID=A0AAD9H0Z5_9STRA|nr:Mitochondrial amidoxime reducing component 2 [Phytophthora citrophthora]
MVNIIHDRISRKNRIMSKGLTVALLLPAVCAAAPTASSAVPYAALLVASIAILVVAFSAKKKPSEPQKSSSSSFISVLQRDELQEQKAEKQKNLLPINAVVALKRSLDGQKTGTIASYESNSDNYKIKLANSSIVTLKASELQFPKVTGLFVYPVKSCAGVALENVQLTPKGLLHDREWVIIDGDRDKFVTQRRYPKLALIHPKVLPGMDQEAKSLVLTAKGMPDLEVPVVQTEEGQQRVVSIWKDKVEAIDQGDAAAKWLDEFMGEEKCKFRLTRVRDGYTRHTKPKYAPGYATNFADAFPFLLALEESLEDFNTTLKTPVPMNRFRPNIVLRGSPAFADEHWNCITIDGTRFRNVRPCARCAMPSVNQETGEIHPEREPSRAIVRERNGVLLGFTDGKKFEGYFGSNMVVEGKEGDLTLPKLAIGANVKVLTLKSEIVA